MQPPPQSQQQQQQFDSIAQEQSPIAISSAGASYGSPPPDGGDGFESPVPDPAKYEQLAAQFPGSPAGGPSSPPMNTNGFSSGYGSAVPQPAAAAYPAPAPAADASPLTHTTSSSLPPPPEAVASPEDIAAAIAADTGAHPSTDKGLPAASAAAKQNQEEEDPAEKALAIALKRADAVPPMHRILGRTPVISRIAAFYCRSLREVSLCSQLSSKWRNVVLGNSPRICERLFDSRVPSASDVTQLAPSVYLSPQNLQVISSAAAAAQSNNKHGSGAAAVLPPVPLPGPPSATPESPENRQQQQQPIGQSRSVPAAQNEQLLQHQKQQGEAAAASSATPEPKAKAEENSKTPTAVRNSAEARRLEKDYKEIFAQARVILASGTSAMRREVIRAFQVEHSRLVSTGRHGCTSGLRSDDPAQRVKRTVFEFGAMLFAFRNARRPPSWVLSPTLPIIDWNFVHLRLDLTDEEMAAAAAAVKSKLPLAVQEALQQGQGQQNSPGAAAAAPAVSGDASSPNPPNKSKSDKRARPHIAEVELCAGEHAALPDFHFMPPGLTAVRRCRCPAHCRYTDSQIRRMPDSRTNIELKRLGQFESSWDDPKVLAGLCSLRRLSKISLEHCRISVNVNALLGTLARKHIEDADSVPVTHLSLRKNKVYGVLDLTLPLHLDKFEYIDLSENELVGPLQLELLPKALPNVTTFGVERNLGLENGATTICVPLHAPKLRSIHLPKGTRVLPRKYVDVDDKGHPVKREYDMSPIDPTHSLAEAEAADLTEAQQKIVGVNPNETTATADQARYDMI